MQFLRKHSKDIVVCLIFALILYLFYKSIFAELLIIPFFFFYRKFAKKEEDRKYKEILDGQFKDQLVSLSAALRAGYSIENALGESLKEMRLMYGDEAPISIEIKKMLNQINLGVNAEKVFANFAKRSGLESAEIFSEVFQIAKKSGGDMVAIIKKTADDISSKIETRSEISVMVASKKFEQNIMSLMPVGIILYMGLTSSEMLSPLYGNALGIVIMTVCLILYGFAFYLSRKILNIDV